MAATVAMPAIDAPMLADVDALQKALLPKPLSDSPIPDEDMYAKYKTLQQRVEFLDIQVRVALV
jgi:hypothetical protein